MVMWNETNLMNNWRSSWRNHRRINITLRLGRGEGQRVRCRIPISGLFRRLRRKRHRLSKLGHIRERLGVARNALRLGVVIIAPLLEVAADDVFIPVGRGSRRAE